MVDDHDDDSSGVTSEVTSNCSCMRASVVPDRNNKACSSELHCDRAVKPARQRSRRPQQGVRCAA